MLITPHIATGVAVGALLGNPLLVVPVAFFSHFVLDSIPHWQETLAPYEPTKKTYVRIPIDAALALSIILFAVHAQPNHALVIWLGALFASAADLDVIVIVFPKLKRGLLKKYWDWHCAIQRETSSLWGVATQISVMAVALLTVYKN